MKREEKLAKSEEQRAESKVLLSGCKQQVASNQQRANIDISTVCLSATLDPPEVNSGQAMKGATQISVEMTGSMCGISPVELVPIYREVRGSTGFGMTTNESIEERQKSEVGRMSRLQLN